MTASQFSNGCGFVLPRKKMAYGTLVYDVNLSGVRPSVRTVSPPRSLVKKERKSPLVYVSV